MVHFFVFFLFAFEITTLDWSIDFIANVQDIVSIEKIDEMCGGEHRSFPTPYELFENKGILTGRKKEARLGERSAWYFIIIVFA